MTTTEIAPVVVLPTLRPGKFQFACAVAAVIAAVGFGMALYFGVAPTQVIVHEAVNVIDTTGSDGSSLTVSDRTRPVVRSVSCVPLSDYDDSADQDAACGPKSTHRLRIAGIGVLVFAAGIGLWVRSGGDRHAGFTGHPT